MTWARVDDHANEHHKQLAAGPEACWLWVCGLMYANRQKERDGFIPETVIESLFAFEDVARLVSQLVRFRLWKKVSGGFQIVDLGEQGALGPCGAWHTGAYQIVYQRDGRVCRYCGSVDDLTIDHIVPRCQGGSDEPENLTPACRRCNSQKGGRTPEQAGMVLQ